MSANVYLPGVIFIPSALNITAISKSYPMVITVSVPVQGYNSYQANQLVKLTIPVSYGMIQASDLLVQILMVSGNSISVDVDSTNFDAFVVPSPALQIATLAPYGSRNLQFGNNTNSVAFQPLNNTGN